MALIRCPECNREISDKATSCPNCGFPQPGQCSIGQNYQAEKPEKKGFSHLLKILLVVQILCFLAFLIFPTVSATITTLSLYVTVILCVPNFVLAALCLNRSTKVTTRAGKTTGVITIIFEIAVIMLCVFSIFTFPKNKENNYKSSANDKIAEAIQEETDDSDDVADDDFRTSIEIGTDWSSYEPLYIGDLPVGCIMVPDATPENVSCCISEHLQTDEQFVAKPSESKYIKSKMVLEHQLNVYGCIGTAIFNYDWNDTLSSIVFKFDDGGAFSPELFNKLHDEVSSALGVESCWGDQYGLHKKAENDHYYSCSWKDENIFDCVLSCYFDESGKPDGGQIKFERTVSAEKANYNVLDEDDTIIQNGVKITASYHPGSNPYVDGTATNNSDKTVSFLKVKIALYDKEGKVIDTTWTYAVGAEGIAPGESTQWTAYCTDAAAIKISVIN